jgi:hypothetical protein
MDRDSHSEVERNTRRSLELGDLIATAALVILLYAFDPATATKGRCTKSVYVSHAGRT